MLSVAAAFSSSFDMLTLIRAGTGIVAGGVIPVAMAAIGDRAPMSERQILLGRFLVLMIIGQMAGAACSGLIAEHVGWRSVSGHGGSPGGRRRRAGRSGAETAPGCEARAIELQGGAGELRDRLRQSENQAALCARHHGRQPRLRHAALCRRDPAGTSQRRSVAGWAGHRRHWPGRHHLRRADTHPGRASRPGAHDLRRWLADGGRLYPVLAARFARWSAIGASP